MTLAGPFVAVIPQQVRDLGAETALLLAHLTYVTSDGPQVLRAADIADGTGLSVRTVQRVTSRLRDLGFISSERAATWDASKRWTVLISAGHAETATLAASSMRDDVVTGSPERVTSQTATLAVSPLELEVEETPPPTPQGEQEAFPILALVRDRPLTAEDYDAELEDLWLLWPTRRRGGKPNARKAYRAARRRGVPAEVIADGYRTHAEAMQVKAAAGQEEERYVPHVSSWLNNEGWTQEPPPPPRIRSANYFADPGLMTRPRTATSDVWGPL